MRIYALSLVVAATEAYAADDVLARLRSALLMFEAGRSDEHAPNHMLNVKATLVDVAEEPTGTTDPAEWRQAAMRRIGKRDPEDVIEDDFYC